MKKIYCTALVTIVYCVLTISISAQATEKGDTLWVDETWSDTIRVTSTVVVPDEVTLTIQPGTYIEFQDYYYMYIKGTILAAGNEADTIVFTVKDTLDWSDLDVEDGAWNGIIFYNGVGWGGAAGAMNDNDTSRFEYCRIEYTKALPSSPVCWSAIEIHQFSRLVISHSEFHHNSTHYRGGAVFFNSDSDIKILNSHFHHNVANQRGGAIHVKNSTPIIKGNIIEHNRTTSTNWPQGKGGGIDILGMNPIIKNNIIRYNSAIAGSGICMLNSFALIENNSIAYNTGYYVLPDLRSIGGGIYMDETSTPKIINNKITNNTARECGGIYAIESQPLIINNLVANNTGEEAGGAFFFWNSEAAIINNTICNNESPMGSSIEMTNSEVAFVNNIAWNNDVNNDFHVQDNFARLEVVNSIIQYGESAIWGIGEYTVANLDDTNPDLDSVSAGIGAGNDGLDVVWSVSPASPAVNKGKTDLGNIKLPDRDIAGDKRIYHTFIDIGAYEVHVESIDAPDTIDVNTTWIADTVKINSHVVVNDDIVLAVLPGTYVEFQDTFHLKINGTLIARGTEENLIRFTVKDTTGWDFKQAPFGGWQGIVFDNSYDGMNNAMADNIKSVLQYCHFSFAKAPKKVDNGGAIRLRYYDNIDISDCIFDHNRSWWDGGAISLDKSDVKVTRCLFTRNEANSGAGIFAASSDMEIKDCLFSDNHCWDLGAAIMTGSSELLLRDNTFTFNSSNNNGGAVFLTQVLAEIRNNSFINNSSGNRGGAIAAYYENCQVINNVFANNQAGGAGGGIYFRYIDEAITVNNTICNNLAQWGGGMFTLFANHKASNDILYGNDCFNYARQYGYYSATSVIEFNNCNIQGGLDEISVSVGGIVNALFNDVIDSLPSFIRPTDGPGTDFDGTSARWYPRSISPCINNGTNNGIAQYIGSIDIDGNPRIFDTIIDIGAYESQYGLPVITVQPFNQVVCDGDTVYLSLETQFLSYCQWQKNGMNIEGATGPVYIIEGVNPDQTGNYQCIVSNAFGSVKSIPVFLGVESAPEIIKEPLATWGIEGARTILSCAATGTPPLHFQWYKDGNKLNKKIWPELWVNNTGTGDEGLYHCAVRNTCGVTQTDSVQVYIAPQICMVTVDTNDSHNLVVWEKKSTAPIASYNIYRESIVQGIYDVIGNVSSDDLSVFTDTEVNPAAQSYLYKITAVDPDGNESDIDLCTPHKTLHLLTTENPEKNQLQCDWDPYYGFPYGTFTIYRGTEDGVLDSIHSMASTTSQWLDAAAEPGVNYYYRIVVRREKLCVPSGNKKAGSGPYSHSLSNQDDNRLQVTVDKVILEEGLTIYPNPFTDYTTLKFPNPDHSEYTLLVRNLSGKLVHTRGRITGNEIVLKRENLKAGYYFVELRGKETFHGKVIIE